MVFSWCLHLLLARAVLRGGVWGRIHAGMEPGLTVRLTAVGDGQIAAPRPLLEHLVFNYKLVELDTLSSRLEGISNLVGGGPSDAQIAGR